MEIIKILPTNVANQIAAGEVIQRPSSIIKELLENSLDAKANNIQVYIQDSGRTLIHIIDNGLGMGKEDLKLSFKRHATSKIKDTADLFSINTMGFRGEALASIAAVSHVEAKSKLTSNMTGSRIKIEGGKIIKQEECACGDGTVMKIKNLFYNVPARRKFLKSDKVEMRHITEEFIRIALANPKINMQLFHNKKEIYHLTKDTFRKRIIRVFGNKKDETLVPINEKTTLANIEGFIGKPESAKRTRGEQYFFVNKRFIKNQYLNHSIKKAFEELIPDNYFPAYFININIDANLIDINIHPNKTEIKFQNESEIYSIMRATIKRSLGTYNISPSINFSQEQSFNISYTQEKSQEIKQPQIKIDKTYNPFKEASNINVKEEISLQKKLIDDLYINQVNQNKENIFHIGNQFITLVSSRGILLINQRRAHQRILFEYFYKILKENQGISQQLIFKRTIDISKKDISIIIALKSQLEKVGFQFEKIEKESITIKGIPPECKEENLEFVIQGLIEQYKNYESLELEKTRELAKSLANSLAIHEKKSLKEEEILMLKKELLKCETPNTCPSGKKTMINLNALDIEKYF